MITIGSYITKQLRYNLFGVFIVIDKDDYEKDVFLRGLLLFCAAYMERTESDYYKMGTTYWVRESNIKKYTGNLYEFGYTSKLFIGG